MASNILKNNYFGGPTHFYRRWATCLGSRDNLPKWQNQAGQVAGKMGGPPSVKVAHVYVILRYINSKFNRVPPVEFCEKSRFLDFWV